VGRCEATIGRRWEIRNLAGSWPFPAIMSG
jgi:hypothetical protein